MFHIIQLTADWKLDICIPRFLVSTTHSLLDPIAINKACDSEQVYWCKEIEDATLLTKMLDRWLCYGLCELPGSSSAIADMLHFQYSPYPPSGIIKINIFPGKQNPKQIGLARLISDEVTFAYLMDVYV